MAPGRGLEPPTTGLTARVSRRGVFPLSFPRVKADRVDPESDPAESVNNSTAGGGTPSFLLPKDPDGEEVSIDPGRIPQDLRRRLLEEAHRLGVKPRDLGVSYSFMYKMRKGLKPIPDWVVGKLLSILDEDVIARVLPDYHVSYTSLRTWDLDRMLNFILGWVEEHPASARVLLQTLDAELRRRGIAGAVVYVSNALLEEWENYLRSRVSAGTLSVKQARDHRNYLRRLLEETGGILAPEPVRRVIMSTAVTSPKAAQKMSEAARLFAREIIRDRRLWEELPRFRARSGEVRAPTWDEYCRVLEASKWLPARALLLVALSGLRIETLYTLRMDEVDLQQRVIAPMRDRSRKRDWFSFIPQGARAELDDYLEWRELWLQTGVKGQEGMPRRFLPVKPKRIRAYLYEVMDRVLGYRFQLGKIRHRVTTQLSLHLPSLWVEILTGHAPKRIVQEHYLQRDVLLEMRERYDQAMSTVPCLRR